MTKKKKLPTKYKRGVWIINPKTRVKPKKKKYNRQKENRIDYDE